VLALLLAFALTRAPLWAAPAAPAWSVWPASGTVTSPFGDDAGRWHAGIDIGILRSLEVRAATAGRVVAEFDYRRPFDHGPVLETRRGYVLNILQWLLSDMDFERTQPIPVPVPDEVAEAREAARADRRHTPPWEDPNRLMAGGPGESDRAGAWEPPEEDEALTNTGRHRLMGAPTPRSPEPDDEDDTRPRPSPHPRVRTQNA